MQKIIFGILCFVSSHLTAQELYIYTEPASNMPAKSLSTRLTANLMGPQPWHNRFMQRYTPELMFGLSKKIMVHTGATFSDMHTSNFRWESVYLYGKYRFLSIDDVHKHFRMAVFGEASYSRSPYHNDEVSLLGDKSGVQVGLIATQLLNKLAISGTISHSQVFDESRYNKVLYIPSRIYQSLNYSLSAGYLLIPRQYTDYKQLNINFYTELLAQQTLDRQTYYVDLAPAFQFIFNSNFKINLGYRFEVSGNSERMARQSWLVGFERTFLNALKSKKKNDHI